MDRIPFPEEFEFYHLGEVHLEEVLGADPLSSEILTLPHRAELDESNAISFHLHGDIRAELILLFDAKLDQNIYSEMGNILAAKIAKRLGEIRNEDILISPPQVLSNERLEGFLMKIRQTLRSEEIPAKRKPKVRRCHYLHTFDGNQILVDTLFISAPMEGAAYDQNPLFSS